MAKKNMKADVDAATKDLDFKTQSYQIELQTTMGPIRLALMPELAPKHCASMIGLARSGFYDGVIFHRVIPDFVIQGGCPEGTGTGGPGYTIPAEFNSTPHEAGILSMARTSDPNSAGSQFVLCLGRVPHLDNSYTVFGKAADDESLKTILAIGNVETNGADRPLEDVTINKATVTATAK